MDIIKSKIKYITLGLIAVACMLLFFISIDFNDKNEESTISRIGENIWTYNMNEHKWHKYNSRLDDDNLNNVIILQRTVSEDSGDTTVYKLNTTNMQVPKEDFWADELSVEFLVNDRLYSYHPRNFEFYEIIFNGVIFRQRKLSVNEVGDIFKGYEIIRVSQLRNEDGDIKFSKFHNKFMIINDIGDKFYRYFIIPNDSSKMKIDTYSNQFRVEDEVNLQIQRIEGCSADYPCYKINIHN